VAFYTGRGLELSEFFTGMQQKCKSEYPRFLGGDAVSRFVLDGRINKFSGLTVDYLEQASSRARKSDCNVTSNNFAFFDSYRNLFGGAECASIRSSGSLLAYDTLLVFIQGVRNAGVLRPSRDAVLAGIAAINSGDDGAGPLRGVSGKIDYPSISDQDQAIPKDKAILVLRGQASGELTRMLLCGQLDTAQPPPDDCSAPPSSSRVSRDLSAQKNRR
ncbi:MAG: hypothetical protein ACRER6_09490, partial [Pseudomonas sp.]